MKPFARLQAQRRDTISSDIGTCNYVRLENRMVLNGDLGWVILADNTQFDDFGRISSQELIIDTDDDQVADFRTIDSYEYNAEGLTTRYSHEEDAGADGVIDSRYWNEQEYAADGSLQVSLDVWDYEADGQRDLQSRSTWSYDENGNLNHVLTETDLDGDGTFDESYEQTFDGGTGIDENGGWVVIADNSQLDDLGRITLQDITYDTDGDGIGDYRTVDHFDYSVDGLTTSYLHEEDIGADGVIDSRYWNEQEYAADGKLLVSHEAWDYEADGQTDYQTRNTWTYDESGNPVSLLTETDLDGDGTYDESYVESFDPGDGGGVNDGSHVESEDVYDDLGRLISTTNTYFNDADDVPDSADISSWTYLDNGSLNTSMYEVDYAADGVMDYREVGTYEYDGDGGLIAVHYQVDENADGEFDSSYTIDASNSFIDGGNGAEAFMSAGEKMRAGSIENATTNDFENAEPGGVTWNLAAVAEMAVDQNSFSPSIASVDVLGSNASTDPLKLSAAASNYELRLAGSVAVVPQRSTVLDLDDAFALLASEGEDLTNKDSRFAQFGSIEGG